MRWKIGRLEFDEDTRSLKSGAGTHQLEPRQAELLGFFCRNPGRVVSRDDLVDAVWERSAVTDSAINRIVAKLRKALGDDARQSAYIVTIPRKGYRFIASVEPVQPTERPVKSKTTIGRVPKLLTGIAVVLVVAVLTARFVAQPDMPERSRFQSVTALTRGAELEFLPAVSPNQRYLAYSAQVDERLDLYIKDLKTETKRLVSDQRGSAGRGDWSRAGDEFLYLYTAGEACELRIATFDRDDPMAIIDKRTVHDCHGAGIGALAFSHDGRSIIFADAPEPSGVYTIRILNLVDGSIRTPVQPPQFLAANSEFDLHPTANKLLVASPDKSQQLAFYVVDLDTDSLQFLYALNAYACCPIWNHSGTRVLMVGPLPGFSVISMPLDEPVMHTIYDSAHRIHRLKRIPQSPDLVYSGGHYNTNIASIDRRGIAQAEDEITSALPDYLPVLSHDEKTLAYVSDRTGAGAIWLRDASGAHRRLVETTSKQRYYDLKWSPSDTKLAALTLNSVELVDVLSGDSMVLDIPQQEIRGLSWFDNQTLAFSLFRGDQWQVYHYDLTTRRLSPIQDDVAYRYYAGSTSLDLTQDGELDIAGLDLPRVVGFGRRFQIEVRGNTLFYLRSDDDGQVSLRRHDLLTGTDEELLELPGYTQFTVGRDRVWFVRDAQQNADIFRIEF